MPEPPNTIAYPMFALQTFSPYTDDPRSAVNSVRSALGNMSTRITWVDAFQKRIVHFNGTLTTEDSPRPKVRERKR